MACKSLQHIFENPLPEKPTLLESLSSSQIKPIKPIEQSSLTEIFGELNFEESPSSSSSSSSVDFMPSNEILRNPETKNHIRSLKKSSESLHLCTEGLGFESSDDVEELKSGMSESWEKVGVKMEVPLENSCNGEYCRRTRVSVGETEYPPPISCIGRNGKPWVCFKAYRNNGRFVLKEIRMPTQEFLHAYRENGRLRLNLVQPDDDDEFVEEEDEEKEEEEEDDEEDDGESGACETDQVNEEKEIDG